MAAHTAMNDHDRYVAGLVPLVIGVTGHRDLVDAEVPQIRKQVAAFLTYLRQKLPDRPLRIVSPLAEGADQLVAEVAFELDVKVTAVLPMPADLYVADFQSRESRERFERLRSSALEVLELPLLAGVSAEQVSRLGELRNRQYAQLGVFLCAHSHILLALWDGKPSEEMGGTAQVVHFHHRDVMAGYSSAEDLNAQILVDDDGDLVYQIVVSRRRDNGQPQTGLMPLQTFWLLGDEDRPRVAELPEKYLSVLERTSEFNRDAKRFEREILAQCYPLVNEKLQTRLPASAPRINRLFCAADWLAIYYQRRFIKALKFSHMLVFAMAMMILLYSDVKSSQSFMVAFGICLLFAAAVQALASRGSWHAKYLEYRTLAEGLRVQFYWAVAGVTSASITKYAHDNFLQKQDIELAWIRNVMRFTGMGSDAAPGRDPEGLAFVRDEWIGDETSGGQLKYYRSKTGQHLARSARLEDMGRIVGVLVLVLIGTAVIVPSDRARAMLFVAVGIMLLIVSVREAYAYRVAEKEVIKQYDFMHRIFHNARRRLARARTEAEQRRILRVLGEAALDEHAEWILLHRERPLSKSQLWRMEG